jgi:hypothetical protein
MDIVHAGEYPEILSVDRCSALQQGPGKWNDFSGMIALGFKALRRHINPMSVPQMRRRLEDLLKGI